MKKYFKINPPFVYKMFIGLMLLVWIFPSGRIIQYPLNLTGLPLLVIGICIAIKAKKLFQKTGTPISPEASPVILHKEGIYKYSRNPMYLGIVIGLAGIAILTTQIINLIFPLVYLIIMYKLFIRKEEVNLSDKFGDDFLVYKKTTRRWI